MPFGERIGEKSKMEILTKLKYYSLAKASMLKDNLKREIKRPFKKTEYSRAYIILIFLMLTSFVLFAKRGGVIYFILFMFLLVCYNIVRDMERGTWIYYLRKKKYGEKYYQLYKKQKKGGMEKKFEKNVN